MSDNSQDMALASLLEAGREIAPGLGEQALKQAYDIEKSFQFDEARESPMRQLQKLVEEIVANGAPQ